MAGARLPAGRTPAIPAAPGPGPTGSRARKNIYKSWPYQAKIDKIQKSILREIRPDWSFYGRTRAELQTAVKQRLGYVLMVLGLDRMAEEVRKCLPERLAMAQLQTRTVTSEQSSEPRLPWMVLDNAGLARELS